MRNDPFEWVGANFYNNEYYYVCAWNAVKTFQVLYNYIDLVLNEFYWCLYKVNVRDSLECGIVN